MLAYEGSLKHELSAVTHTSTSAQFCNSWGSAGFCCSKWRTASGFSPYTTYLSSMFGMPVTTFCEHLGVKLRVELLNNSLAVFSTEANDLSAMWIGMRGGAGTSASH